MIKLTEKAVLKVKEIMAQQNPVPGGLRIAVVGGGCSGFSYHMAFVTQEEIDGRKASAAEKGDEAKRRDYDDLYEQDGIVIAIDQMSAMYLDGVEVDWIETLEGSGFKFNNPNVKSQCGCGSSFSV